MRWPGVSESGTVIIGVPLSMIELWENGVWYNNELFEPKTELHITLFGTFLGEQLQPLESKIAQAFESTGWEILLNGQLYHLKKGENQSIITMITLNGLDTFFNKLKKISGKSHSRGPAHITLYTRGDPKGIGLPNMQAFEQYVTAPITLDDLRPQK